ncbi:uncharacterized protein B0T15DRAFT_518972 [Chaetomium strumarium]|uniref:Uncharacterized protein n=1 Tax=Chaetomium strumarium TaxID=1170767 RepID=A0AAJ0H2J3_9PEZI|nr:hypothetical protein B0T15DRAFT_518972 [Chaetomium strumarium]
MRCQNRGEVANLLQPPRSISSSGRVIYNRANYNFTHYLPRQGPGRRRGVRWEEEQWGVSKSTIEFREAAGTMDPLWVGVWASVCLGIFRFARDAENGRFWAVIERLAKAEAEEERTGVVGKGRYDLVSLLFDWGLFAEGLYLEKKLKKVDDDEEGSEAGRFWFPCRVLDPNANGGPTGYSDFVLVETSPTPEAGFAGWGSSDDGPATAAAAAQTGFSGAETWERDVAAALSGWTVTRDGQPVADSGGSSDFVHSPPPQNGLDW